MKMEAIHVVCMCVCVCVCGGGGGGGGRIYKLSLMLHCYTQEMSTLAVCGTKRGVVYQHKGLGTYASTRE